MKIRNIFGLTLAAAFAFGACAEKDTTAVDQWLGEKFNQEIRWDVDSLAFRRTNWESQELISGVQLRKSSINMWESVQSVSYIAYSPVLYSTGVGYTGAAGTVGDIASTYENAAFAINAGGFANGTAADFLKVEDALKNAAVSESAEAIFGLTTKELGDNMSVVEAKLTSDMESHTGCNSAIATGAMIVRNGKAVKSFPEEEFYTTRMARTFIGLNAAGNVIIGVIDGGQTGVADGATAAEAGFIAQLMGLKAAALLGCGDETTVWSAKDGVLNAPSAGSAQKVGSVIYVGKGSVTVEGDGSQSNPYLIKNHVHMMLMRSLCAAGSTNYFRMEADVDMSEVKNWTPFNYDDPYTRQIHFDGNGKTISNFAPDAFVQDDQATASPYASLFGVLYGSCKNLTVKDSKVLADIATGSATGILGGFIGSDGKAATIENVKVVNCHARGGRDVGLFGGQSRDASIKNCIATGKVEGGNATAGDCGGFIGRLAGEFVIDNCHADVEMVMSQKIEKNFRFGGLLGFCATIGGTDLTRDKLTVTKCSAKGSILNDSYSLQTAGGLIGYIQTPNATISECYTDVAILGGRTENGGTGGNTQCVGGIVGIISTANEAIVSNCYSTSEKPFIVGQKSGGVVGIIEKGKVKIENCYTDMTFHGYSGLGSILGLNAAAATGTEITKCFGWCPSITAFREAGDKYSSGALVGCSLANITVAGCFRSPSLTFSDGFRTMGEQADIAGAIPPGDANQQAFDGMPATTDNLNEVAQGAGWSADVWDFSGAKPQLKWALK